MSRQILDLSNQKWQLWLDREASWEEDPLFNYKESQDATKLPINPPTCGWDRLNTMESKSITLPATVEEYYSTGNEWEYHGVSWFYTDFSVPTEFEGERLCLHFEKTRLRAEIYVNEQLVGYDLVSETPYDVDITGAVHKNKSNRLAVRLTNAGGTRGWNDIFAFKWGENTMLPSHDFTTMGQVHLVTTAQTYISDVFVKNVLPACENNLDIITEVKSQHEGKAEVTIHIAEVNTELPIFKTNFSVSLTKGENTFTHKVCVPKAKLWDIDTPNLYTCKVQIQLENHSDAVDTRFGFRVMEVKESTEGNLQYFLNGKRFRHKSAIDWGYYAHVGAYATEEMARRSVENAKAIGHNAINFHRQIGEPIVMDLADEIGLYMYEEPGGIKSGDLATPPKDMTPFKIEEFPFLQDLFKIRLTRMIRRDRNHPSLLIYTMANEDMIYSDFRREVLKLANELDDSRFIVNSSGSNNVASFLNLLGSFTKKGVTCIPERRLLKKFSHYNYKPYSTTCDTDHVDCHTVNATAMFEEPIFVSHGVENAYPTRYWGEVGCYCGPANWYAVCEDQKKLAHGQSGYDNNIYKPMHDLIDANYEKWNLEGTCGGAIKSKYDISSQAGRGLMYIDGRYSQAICSHDGNDGYAINGWSSGPQAGSSLPSNQRASMDWDSALCDEARNLKGPAEDYAYWSRSLQVALFRKNGAYFTPGKKVKLRCVLINEGILAKGDYKLSIKVKDTQNKGYIILKDHPIQVAGGDIFSQELQEIAIPLKSSLMGGHITIKATLYDEHNKVVTEGTEQVLLHHPESFKERLEQLNGCVYKWKEGKRAIKEACGHAEEYEKAKAYTYIAAGEVPTEEDFKHMLDQVKEGCRLIVNFDESWAALLHKTGILSAPVTEWGCEQTGFWYGNGWGYVSEFFDDAFPSGNVISTNGWQPQGDPNGFYPFESDFEQKVHGLWMARHDVLRVTIATLAYGKGQVILNPAYNVSHKDPFATLMFYNMLTYSNKKK